jgi:hypothetical protein
MKFEECIPALRLGKKIKRQGWGEFCHLHANDNFKGCYFIRLIKEVPEAVEEKEE